MTTKPRRVPQRMCVVCREVQGKRALIRIVRTPTEGVLADPTGKRAGRGAYLCQRPSCWERALSGQVLARALHTTLTVAEITALRDYAANHVSFSEVVESKGE
ncbi:YlxR family protein [Candidatus Amarolinea dominans]|uniref:RNase P modulator RnpM n=1 Tax=Candidatus Amarolinea dominans TaxID=3140696 RepID=UPI0031CCC6FA